MRLCVTGLSSCLTGSWEHKFPVDLTHKRTFRLNEKEVVKVPMMKTKANFLATVDNELDCGVLQLPYVGNISMLIVLPYKLSGMKTLEKQLTPHVVERWQKSMTNRYVSGWAPAFFLRNPSLVSWFESVKTPPIIFFPFIPEQEKLCSLNLSWRRATT